MPIGFYSGIGAASSLKGAGLLPSSRAASKYSGFPGMSPEDIKAGRPYARRGPGKTTAELEAEGNVGQGRMAYEDRVGQRKQNVALRRRAKYLDRSRRMGRRPRKYTSPAYRAVQRYYDAMDRGGGETLPFGSIPIGAFSPPITV